MKRSRLEIYLDVLRVIKNGVHKPTRIMYTTNLSWNPLQEILNSLISQDLIVMKDDGSRKRYEITEKGRTALKYFRQTKELVSVERVRGRSRIIYPF